MSVDLLDFFFEISSALDDFLYFVQSVYVKDNFFDSLSYGALDHEHGKTEHVKSSEQRKIDKEVQTVSFKCKYLKNQIEAYLVL
jgi:hypothetical protein